MNPFIALTEGALTVYVNVNHIIVAESDGNGAALHLVHGTNKPLRVKEDLAEVKRKIDRVFNPSGNILG